MSCMIFDASKIKLRPSHVLYLFEESHVRVNSDSTVTVCWNYLNGYCRHHNCWFYHPSPVQLIAYQLHNRGIPQVCSINVYL